MRRLPRRPILWADSESPRLPPDEGSAVAQSASTLRSGCVLALCALLLVAAAPRSVAAEVEDPSLLREGGFGAASALVSFVYAPVKIAYALGGLMLGGSSFLWTWGDKSNAGTVITMALGGDYVITPEHLGGAEDVEFTGEY